jgi:CDP-diacylglycerol--glycerol-3-phosphate 3-phosphatidyltransferase
VERAPLTFRRLIGLDRSGPAPPETLPGQPLRPWTIPNLIGYIRLAAIPVFVLLALNSESGTDALPAVLFAGIAFADYLDGMSARITGQYSRMGTLLDPLTDRLLVIAGIAVCWKFDTLPRWAIAILLARELFVLVAGQAQARKGVAVEINWFGRAGVWPTMSGIFFALAGVQELAVPLFLLGVAMALVAAGLYVRAGLAISPSSSA